MLLQFLRVQDAHDPYAFRFEPQDYILPSAGGDSPTAHFDWTPKVLADLQAVRLPGRDPAVVQRVGEQLRRFIKDAGWAQHEREIAQAIAERRPIFLTIRSSAAELYALPWELLTLKSGQHIGEVDGLLLRFEWPEKKTADEHPIPRPEGGRILFAWSAAGGAVPVAKHAQAIRAACKAGFHPFNADTDVLSNASMDGLCQRLEAAQTVGPPIAVLHLLCHGATIGSTFGLCLDGESGAVVLDAAQLRQALAPFASMVRLVVLSSCDSGNLGMLGNQLGSVAQALHRCGFASVLASRFPLSVSGSVTLAESFYGELLSGPASLETAFLHARKRLCRSEAQLPGEQRQLDWASVQLYARHEDGDDTRPVVFRPFRGLLAFQPEHRRFFFGRDKEVAEIVNDLQALIDHNKVRFLVVAGASGTGKSSVVFAGAVPRLLAQNPRLQFLKMRPGIYPERALNDALANWSPGTEALLVVDQFEEIFTQTAESSARDAFARRLWSLASAPEPGLRVIVTLRVDFIGRGAEIVLDTDELRLDRVAYDEEHRVFIAQLKLEQLRSAIIEPARKVGLELQAGLVDRMLGEVGREPGALPLLEDMLDMLWLCRDQNLLLQDTYDELGGVVGALQKRADSLLQKLTSTEDLAIARQLLISLVAVAEDTTLDTRLRIHLADMQNTAAVEHTLGFERVLSALVSARLLVQDDDGQSSTVEVAHEALIRKWPTLRSWLDEDRAGLLLQRRLNLAAQHWEAQKRDESLLYRGTQLDQAREWRKTWEPRLRPLGRSFLDASEALREQQEKEEQERQRREREAVERLKQKSIEAHDALLIAVAQTIKEDPTAVATLLREVVRPASRLWTQSCIDALRAGVAESVLRGHESSVRSVAFSPDGRKVVTGSGDKTARVWNTDGSGAPIVLKGHLDKVVSVMFSPDGATIVTGSWDKTARVWNADGSSSTATLNGHEGKVTSVAFSRDGHMIATGSWDKTARVWNADGSGAPVVLSGHTSEVCAVAFSPDGKKIATGSGDSTVRIWNSDGSGNSVVFSGHASDVFSVAFSPDGNQVISGSYDNTARVWNTDGSGDPVVLTGHMDSIYSVAFSPSGKAILTGSKDQTARLWKTDDWSTVSIFRGHAGAITSVAFSPDGGKIATGCWDKTARVWNAGGSGAPVVLEGHDGYVTAVAFSPDGRKVVSGSWDKTAWVWSADGFGAPIALRGHAAYVSAVAFSPDGRKIVTGSKDKATRIFNADGSGTPVELRVHAAYVTAVAFSPDGTKIATGSWDKTVCIFDTDISRAPVVLKGHESAVTALAFSPDGTKIVTVSLDKTARIFNTDGTGAPLVVAGHEDSLSSVAFSPDGTKIVTGSLDKIATIFNADGSDVPLVLKGHEDAVTAVAFSPDGTKIATGSLDKTVRIFNTDGSSVPLVLKGHEKAVYSVAFSPDGMKIASGSGDQSVRIWIISDAVLLAMLWNVTSECLPIERRQEILLESPADAQQGYERCRQEVARRHGWRIP